MLQAILERVSSVDKKVNRLEQKMDEGFVKVNQRLDTIGTTVAQLEDDTPTREEHHNLDKRVTKLEKTIASN